ncbi:hypothetical protein Mapa_009444 [Marchantia paleacea]|nr:hypothetical protein Mapa_009444 [Marchantia paleacea]
MHNQYQKITCHKRFMGRGDNIRLLDRAYNIKKCEAVSFYNYYKQTEEFSTLKRLVAHSSTIACQSHISRHNDVRSGRVGGKVYMPSPHQADISQNGDIQPYLVTQY